MSVTTIRAAVKTELEAISSLSGVTVNDYRRRVNEWAEIESDFKATDKIHTWIIKYTGSTFEWDTDISGYIPIRIFEIWGLYSLNDANASEKAFDDIVNDIEDDLANLRTIVSGGNRISSLSTAMDEYSFAGILCNRCILNLEIREGTVYA